MLVIILYLNQKFQSFQLDFRNQFNAIDIDSHSGKRIKEIRNANTAFQEMFQDKESNNVFIFTDDSRTETDSNATIGMANWSPSENFVTCFKFFDLTSIFSAEAIALLDILKLIKKIRFK